jgi:hypothetical protein
VTVRLVAGLTGDLLLVLVLERASGLAVLRAGAAAALLLYPAFLLVPGFWAKLVLLAALSMVTRAAVPGAAGPAVRRPARAQRGRGHAEQRGGAVAAGPGRWPSASWPSGWA